MTTPDPQHWHDLALEKRIMASRMKDPLAKATMTRLALHYEELARQAEGSPSTSGSRLGFTPPSQTPNVSPRAIIKARAGGPDALRAPSPRHQNAPVSHPPGARAIPQPSDLDAHALRHWLTPHMLRPALPRAHF